MCLKAKPAWLAPAYDLLSRCSTLQTRLSLYRCVVGRLVTSSSTTTATTKMIVDLISASQQGKMVGVVQSSRTLWVAIKSTRLSIPACTLWKVVNSLSHSRSMFTSRVQEVHLTVVSQNSCIKTPSLLGFIV